MARPDKLNKAQYETLAAFRYALRKFIHFSETAAQAAGITSQQHQVLLAIRGFPGRDQVTVSELAERLQLRHHSAVGLVDRLVIEKLVARGGINLSELDGWWAEAYVPELGWALGDGQEHGNDPSWDVAEAEALYERLEREVIPEFYTRNEKGIPTAWITRMRESMARLAPRFSANRAVCEYTEQHYLPAAVACQSRMANKGIIGKQMVDWRHSLDQKWAALHFGAVKVETRDGKHIIEVQVSLYGLDPKAVRVELYADGIKENPPVRQEMTCLHPLADESDGYVYSATVSATRPPTDYTDRVMPHCDGVVIPLEDALILWQR
ncbi:MAG TPA: MarR family transcriptional regulator [Verrucomicrobiae bacterium]